MKRGPGAQKGIQEAVICVMKKMSDKDGVCRLSIDKLCKLTGHSQKGVNSAIMFWMSKGLISINPPRSGSRATTYNLVLKKDNQLSLLEVAETEKQVAATTSETPVKKIGRLAESLKSKVGRLEKENKELRGLLSEVNSVVSVLESLV